MSDARKKDEMLALGDEYITVFDPLEEDYNNILTLRPVVPSIAKTFENQNNCWNLCENKSTPNDLAKCGDDFPAFEIFNQFEDDLFPSLNDPFFNDMSLSGFEPNTIQQMDEGAHESGSMTTSNLNNTALFENLPEVNNEDLFRSILFSAEDNNISPFINNSLDGFFSEVMDSVLGSITSSEKNNIKDESANLIVQNNIPIDYMALENNLMNDLISLSSDNKELVDIINLMVENNITLANESDTVPENNEDAIATSLVHTGENDQTNDNLDVFTSTKLCKLKKHVLKHTKQINCSDCSFRTDVKEKRQKNSRKNPSKNPICDQKIRRKGNTAVHSNKVRTLKKPFSCSQCTFSCARKNDLYQHLRTHTGEKPFACSECDYRCSVKGSLTKHMRIHTGERPYKCSQCGYEGKQMAHLTAHMLSHTKEKPFSCEQCYYKCRYKSMLTKHMAHHNFECHCKHGCRYQTII